RVVTTKGRRTPCGGSSRSSWAGLLIAGGGVSASLVGSSSATATTTLTVIEPGDKSTDLHRGHPQAHSCECVDYSIDLADADRHLREIVATIPLTTRLLCRPRAGRA